MMTPVERATLLAARCTRQAAIARRAGFPDDAATLADSATAWRALIPTPRRQCSQCPKRAAVGRYECAEHDDGLPDGEPVDRAPLTPGGVLGDLL